MKNIFRILVLISCFSWVFSACDNELDINQNPNLPITVDKNVVLTSAQASLATILGGFLTNYGGFMAQYHTQSPAASQYVAIDAYNVDPSFTNDMWIEVMAGGVKDLDYVIEKSIKENTADTYLVAKVLRAYIFQVMTDLYGDIPYAESLLSTKNLSPNVVVQQDIYKSLLATIDEALSRYANNQKKSIEQSQDVMLNGNMEAWIQFANTLKLKMYVRLVYTDLANETEVLKLIAEDNFIKQNVSFDHYIDETNQRNPFVDVQLVELLGANNSASNSLLKFYKNNNDTRITKVYEPSIKSNEFIGLNQGEYNSTTNKNASNFASPKVSATQPVYFMTISESNFLQAEALIRYNAGTGAKEKYEEGIRASFEQSNLDVSDAEALITGAYAYISNPDIEVTIRQVIVQKWAAMAYVNTIEAYFEQLRTGYPEFVFPPDSPNYTIGNLIPSQLSRFAKKRTPNSMWYPDVEVTTNRNVTQKTELFEKVWWDQK